MSGSTKVPHPYFGVRPWNRHGMVLLAGGIAYMVNGLAYFKKVPEGPRWEALTVARDWMPLSWWAVVWIAVGLLAIISSRWPPVAETWGYTMMTALAMGWGGFYVVGVIFEGAPIENLGAAATWFMFAFLWWAISGLVSPDKVVVVDGQR